MVIIVSKNKNDSTRFAQKLQDIAFTGVDDVNGKHIDFKSTQAFADYLGVSRQTLGFWLKGERTPDMDYLVKISKALNMSIDYLVGNSDSNSLDADVQNAVMYTGLTEETINAIGKRFDGRGAYFLNTLVASGHYDAFMIDFCKGFYLATSLVGLKDEPILGKGKVDGTVMGTTKRDVLRMYGEEIGRIIGNHASSILTNIADGIQDAVEQFISIKKEV